MRLNWDHSRWPYITWQYNINSEKKKEKSLQLSTLTFYGWQKYYGKTTRYKMVPVYKWRGSWFIIAEWITTTPEQYFLCKGIRQKAHSVGETNGGGQFHLFFYFVKVVDCRFLNVSHIPSVGIKPRLIIGVE